VSREPAPRRRASTTEDEYLLKAATTIAGNEPPSRELLKCLRLVACEVMAIHKAAAKAPRRSTARATLIEIERHAERLAVLLETSAISAFQNELTAERDRPGSGVPAVDSAGLLVLATRAAKVRQRIPAGGGETSLDDTLGVPRAAELVAVAVVKLMDRRRDAKPSPKSTAAQGACANLWTAAGLPERQEWEDQLRAVRMRREQGWGHRSSRVLTARRTVSECMRKAGMGWEDRTKQSPIPPP
jgi:hypothetical protein